MRRTIWIAMAALRTLSRRYLKGRTLWEWHHHKMTTHPPYARIFIRGVVKAFWQESFDKFLVVLAKTVAQLGRYLKHGTDPTK